MINLKDVNIILTGATLTSFGTPEEFCKEIGIDNLGNYEIFDSEFDSSFVT